MLAKGIQKLVEGKNLSEKEVAEVMNCIMEGEATPAQIGGFVTALRIKGETIEEIAGCAKVMRQKAETINLKADYFVDTCGTGGDGANTFNISTAASFVAAAGGVIIAKHGNRSMSSKSGSIDVLEALGIDVFLTPGQVERCIEKVGIGFMFAQRFHTSMKYAAGPRKELGIKTVFNILGPLTNPARAKGQILGVFEKKLVEPLAKVLLKLGVEKAMVVYGLDGLDEITTTGKTAVSEVRDGKVISYEINPMDYNMAYCAMEDIRGGDAEANAEIILSVFGGECGAKRDIVLLNAAAALYIGKKAESLEEGVGLAASLIDSGKVIDKLNELRAFIQTFKKVEV